jgi:hypothetical protein
MLAPQRQPVAGALVPLGADQASALALHQRLGQHSNPFPKDIPALFFEKLANKHHLLGL